MDHFFFCAKVQKYKRTKQVFNFLICSANNVIEHYRKKNLNPARVSSWGLIIGWIAELAIPLTSRNQPSKHFDLHSHIRTLFSAGQYSDITGLNKIIFNEYSYTCIFTKELKHFIAMMSNFSVMIKAKTCYYQNTSLLSFQWPHFSALKIQEMTNNTEIDR